jgi:hypothetical protein
MEAIFSRITLAHDTLTDADKRAEYDAYLADIDSTRELEKQLQAPMPPRAAATPPAPLPTPATAAPPKRVSVPPIEARRDALARRLMGGRLSSPPPSPPSVPRRADPDPDALRRHYEDRMTAARDRLAREHVASAREAIARGDWIAATAAFKLALSVAPNDAEIQRECQAAQEKANEFLGAQYKKQASYEEKNGDWVAAARSWVHAAKALPNDADAHERAAHALVKAEGNLHEAAQLGQRAITLCPQNGKLHATLAEVYLAAGLILNAKREAETAARLLPDDASIQTLLKKVVKRK